MLTYKWLALKCLNENVFTNKFIEYYVYYIQKREHLSSEFTQSLTSAIGDKMADVAKELEMSMSDDLLEQFYDNGGDDIELAQCLRAVKLKQLAKRLVYASDNQPEAQLLSILQVGHREVGYCRIHYHM